MGSVGSGTELTLFYHPLCYSYYNILIRQVNSKLKAVIHIFLIYHYYDSRMIPRLFRTPSSVECVQKVLHTVGKVLHTVGNSVGNFRRMRGKVKFSNNITYSVEERVEGPIDMI